MTIQLIHISDFHFSPGKSEGHGVVLDTLFSDLAQQLAQNRGEKPYLAFSGDLVQASDLDRSYEELLGELDQRLNSLGIPKSQRICVPGNHDISRAHILKNQIEHEGVVSQNLDENNFNEYIGSGPSLLIDKFAKYKDFEKSFAEFGVTKSSITGAGWELENDVAVYCLNTALCSSGGIKTVGGEAVSDMGKLGIDTRSLYAWLRTCKSRWKVLIMHHPIDWLSDWAANELKRLVSRNFCLLLSGHTHDQSSFHSIVKGETVVQCSAPPLYTNKDGDLGYAIISMYPDVGVGEIAYRQWTKRLSFVSGVNFSDTDDGKVQVAHSQYTKTKEQQNAIDAGFIERYLTKRLDDALVSFSSQPKLWVTPTIGTQSEAVKRGDEEKVNLQEFLATPTSSFVKAPPQFGLSCLALFMAKEAWRLHQKLWIYLDAKNLKPNPASIQQAVNDELRLLGCNISNVGCILIDSWVRQNKDATKLLQKICHQFKEIPIICMETTDTSQTLSLQEEDVFEREFQELFLWCLQREHIRAVVSEYNEIRNIGDDEIIISRVVSDLEVLNLHRTPLNCLTLLKVAEVDFDESPVNRCDMIKRVLFLLFSVDEVPTYKVRPDLKDCEYVLGYFCETMLRENNFSFSRERFLGVVQKCCEDQFMDLDIHVVFDVLHNNNIIVRRGYLFSFRFAYWIYYFAAQRMHHDAHFASFIFENMRYANYPEIIEFYTGVDRRRNDAVETLIRDMRSIVGAVQKKVGLPDDLNPFRLAQWTSSPVVVEQMHQEIKEGVKSSNLPAAVKDRYADMSYDPARPYNQEIRKIFSEYSFVYMMQITKAASNALRNSDYVEPKLKRELLSEIMCSWHQTSKVLIILLPMLAKNGSASFDGSGFYLSDDNWGDTPEKRFSEILVEIPDNVIRIFMSALVSQKMGPLLIDQTVTETDEIKKHELILVLIKLRPRGWKAHIENYIANSAKNSFYLFDVHRKLRSEYQFSYATPTVLKEIEHLIKIAITKHLTGTRLPGEKQIKRLQGDILPERKVAE